VLDRCLYDTAICFTERLQRLPAYIVDFRCCLCDRVDFCPAVFLYGLSS